MNYEELADKENRIIWEVTSKPDAVTKVMTAHMPKRLRDKLQTSISYIPMESDAPKASPDPFVLVFLLGVFLGITIAVILAILFSGV